MKIIARSDFCRKVNCPTLYCDDDGTYYVQGFIVPSIEKKVPELPADETLVRIDASLLHKIKNTQI